MNIIKIEILDTPKIITDTETHKKYYSVKLFIKKWWKDKPVEIEGHPSGYAMRNEKGTLLYQIYIDEHGNQFPEKVSRQITHFMQVQVLKGKIE